MALLEWFRSADAEAFGRQLASTFVRDVKGDYDQLSGKAAKKATRAMENAARDIQMFRAKHPLNVYKKSRLANVFLWTLLEAGWPKPAAQQLTEWVTLRL